MFTSPQPKIAAYLAPSVFGQHRYRGAEESISSVNLGTGVDGFWSDHVGFEAALTRPVASSYRAFEEHLEAFFSFPG